MLLDGGKPLLAHFNLTNGDEVFEWIVYLRVVRLLINSPDFIFAQVPCTLAKETSTVWRFELLYEMVGYTVYFLSSATFTHCTILSCGLLMHNLPSRNVLQPEYCFSSMSMSLSLHFLLGNMSMSMSLLFGVTSPINTSFCLAPKRIRSSILRVWLVYVRLHCCERQQINRYDPRGFL